MAMMFSHPKPPKEYNKVVQEGITYYLCKPKPKLYTANTSMLVNGIQTATIRYYDGELNSLLGLMVHEAFHVYQANHHFPMGNLLIRYPNFDVLINTLGEIEGKLLYQAIHTKNIEYVKQACDARASRQSILKQIEQERLNQLNELEKEEAKQLSKQVQKEADEKQINIAKTLIELEDYNEIHEGLAVYTEMKALDHKTNRYNEHLEALMSINVKGKGASRQRFYTSGMAYGLLLDYYVPGWQKQLMKDFKSLSSILSEAISHNVNIKRRKFLDVDFDKIYHQQQKDMKQKISELTDKVEQAFPKQGIYVDVKLKGNVVSGGWNPYTVQPLPDGSRLHTTMMLYHYDNQAEIYIAKDVIEKKNCQHFIFECKDASIMFDGKPIKPGEHIGKLQIISDNWKLLIPKAHIHFDDKKLFINELYNKKSTS